MNLKVATVISRIFDPFVSLTAAFIILMYGSPKFIPAFFGMVILPLVLFTLAWKIKYISNWDVSDRRQRPKLLWAIVVIEAISVVIFHVWSLKPILCAIIGFSIITHFWKISGHAMGAAYATGLIIKLFGWGWWPVLLIVPIVGWSRVVRKDHTVAQVIAGALYSWVLLVFIG